MDRNEAFMKQQTEEFWKIPRKTYRTINEYQFVKYINEISKRHLQRSGKIAHTRYMSYADKFIAKMVQRDGPN